MKKRHYLTQASNWIKQFFWRILTVIGGVGLVVLLISAFSDRISPLTNPYIPFLGLFFPFILAFNGLFLLFWLLFKKGKQALVTFVVLVICWGSIHTYFPVHGKTKEVPEDCIKFLTYNVMRFGDITRHTEEHPHPILQYVIEQDPDIVCFQEYLPAQKLTDAVIRQALKATPYYYIGHPGLAIFSKYPILSAEKIPMESAFNGSFIAELNIKGRTVTLINNHLESNHLSYEDRSEYYNLTKEPDTQKLEAFTHLMYQRLTPSFKIRATQAKIISNVIRENKNPYIIVCGDFNDTPISYARHTIKGDLTDSFVESGNGMGISFNTNRFLFRIDYIFHSKNMKSYNCTVGKLKTSDHYPVWTYLQFKD
jgi:endonuclease/exonuclease/phosphatase family metal-dependent hydrolase